MNILKIIFSLCIHQIFAPLLYGQNYNFQNPIDSFGIEAPFEFLSKYSGVMGIKFFSHEPDFFALPLLEGKVVIGDKKNQKIFSSIDLPNSQIYALAIHPKFALSEKFRSIFVINFYGQNDINKRTWNLTRLDLKNDFRIDKITNLITQKIEVYDHFGADLSFDDRNFLLISIGDNGFTMDSSANSQKISKGLFSGILRIDVDQQGGSVSQAIDRQPQNGRSRKYSIPKSNPFVKNKDVLKEFYSIGLRNPFRIYYDRDIKKIYVGEVGQDDFEQIELAFAGSNHQWSYREGPAPFKKSYLQGERPSPYIGIETVPLYSYKHEDRNHCIIGGIIYKGKKFPSLTGHYIFGDNNTGRIWKFDLKNKKRYLILQLPFSKTFNGLSSFSQDNEGNIYITNFMSKRLSIYRLVSNNNIISMPAAYASISNRSIANPMIELGELIPYGVESKLRSDGLMKYRWIRLPKGSSIDNSSVPWKVPFGTQFYKEFRTTSIDGKKIVEKRVETRVLEVGPENSIFGATYEWKGDNASLQKTRKRIKISTIDNFLKKSVGFEYRLPSSNDCNTCHNIKANILGFDEDHLNFEENGKKGEQLLRLSSEHVFKKAYTKSSIPKQTLFGINNPSASIDQKARSFLHSNCRSCHNDQGLSRVDFYTDISLSLKDTKMLNQPAELGYENVDGHYFKKIIDPKQPENSAIYGRIKTQVPDHIMPYLGRYRRDVEVEEIIYKWISTL